MAHLRRPTASRLWLASFALLAACSGKSCTCLAPIPGGFPTDNRRHEDAIQLRVTDGALQYLQANAGGLVSTLLGTSGSSFPIPASCSGTNQVCCLNGMPQTCDLGITVENVSLNPTPPNVLSFTVTTQLRSAMPIPVSIRQGISADCFFSIDTTKGTAGHDAIDLSADVTFAVDSATDLTNIALANTMVANLDQSMLDITPQSGFGNLLACGIANIGFIKTFIIGSLQSTLTGQISSQVGNALCAKCTTQADCDAFADSCKGGRCQRGMSCEQEIGAVGRLDVSSLLAKYSKGESAKMDILAVLGGYADVTPAPSPGLSLGMLGGAMGGPHNPCVPMRPAPETPMVGKWAAWSAETEPRDGMPFHVGIGVHQSHLDTVAWGAFDGGALCLNVGTGSVPQLDSSTVGLVIRSLQDLVHVRDAPMFLAVRPQQEPQITLGAGTFNVDANGMKTIKDPLLHVSIPKLSIDFYAFVDERYVRVMTLTADVTLPVALDVDGMGRIVPLLGDLSSAFGNVTVTNSELLAESPAKLAKTFPMLLAVAVSQFGLLPPVALPKVMGLGIKLVAIEPTNDDAGNPTFLSIFANLDTGNPEPFRATTQAEVAKVAAPPTEAFSVENGLPAEATPSVELRLGGRGRLGDARDLEWSWRIDDGLWSPWSQAQSPSVSDPRLWLQGRHAVEVKARIAGEPATEDPAPVRLEFLVDTVPPAGEFDIAGDELLVDAHDLVSPDSALEYAWRAPGGEWSAWTNEPRIRLPQAAPMLAPETLGVRVRDEAGNVGDAAFHGRTTATGSAASCACDLGGRGRDGGARTSLIALLLLGSALVRRRLLQRSRVVVHCSMLALLALAATAPGCGGSPGGATAMLGKGDLLNPADEIGRYASAVAAKGTIHVSAYDDAEGDLAYAEIDETKLEAPIEWQWIDGVPTGGPMDTPGGYRAGTTTPGDDVGLYTSIALTSTGETRIAYYDATHRALKLATVDADRKFHASFVEQPTAGSAGLYASLVLDGRDVPSIAYLATDIPDGAGGFLSKLRLATAKSPAPASPADWTFVDLDMSRIPCSGLCDKGQACVPTDPMDPTKSACKAVDAAPCPSTCTATQACIAAACVTFLPAVKAPDLVEGIGLFASLKRLSTGKRAVVYYDREHPSLKLALENATGGFAVSFVDGNDPTKDVGQFATVAVAADDTLHVAYVDAVADSLLYKPVKGGVAPMTAEVIDDGMRADGPHPVGSGSAIWLAGSAVRAVYQDQRTAQLWQAVRASNGTWSTAALLMGTAGYGFYPSIVSDGGKSYLVHFAYDRAAQTAGMPLGALHVAPLNGG